MSKSQETTKAEPVKLAPAEVANSPFNCAWRGCRAPGDIPLPPGWHILSFHALCDNLREGRDEVLCPTHARELDALLKPLPDRRLLGDAQGHG